MLQALFENTVSALCYEIAAEQSESAQREGESAFESLEPPYNDITRFVIEQHTRMPRLLGAGVRLATLLFALAALPRGGALFHRLSPERRRVTVAAWSVSRLGPCRDLIRLYSSLAILALYSREQAAGHCG